MPLKFVTYISFFVCLLSVTTEMSFAGTGRAAGSSKNISSRHFHKITPALKYIHHRKIAEEKTAPATHYPVARVSSPTTFHNQTTNLTPTYRSTSEERARRAEQVREVQIKVSKIEARIRQIEAAGN